jgi:hypothetical protein
MPHLCKQQPSAALTAPRAGQAKAWPHLFTMGAFFVRDAMPHLCKHNLRLRFLRKG